MTTSAEFDATSPEAMLLFYKRLYPFRSIFNWLNHEHTPTRRFTHREFAFTLQGDIYLRYNSFTTHEELKKQVCHYNPTRFEIGPVYSVRPRDKKTARPGAFNPVQRELVFDIDMTDYDPVRTCCSGTGMCKRCWGFIAAAVRVIDAAIRDQFGYEKLLWVYSGRRGIHLWISDKEAMDLTDDQRKSIVGWLMIPQPSSKEAKRPSVHLRHQLPPSLNTAVQQLNYLFRPLILEDQNCFASEEGRETMLEFLPEKLSSSKENLRTKWKQGVTDSQTVWEDFRTETKSLSGNPRNLINAAGQALVLYYTYPRLDAEVSKHRNHLLKAPFCVHPKTGRVCVPVDPATIDKFDPEKVPTIGQLLRELDVIKTVGDEPDWQKTSLRLYVEMLDRHAKGLMEATRREKLENDLSW